MRPLFSFVLLALLAPFVAWAQAVSVQPGGETQPSTLATSAQASDVALWVHPTDRSQSLLLVAHSFSGLVSFTLDGRELQLVQEGPVFGVDVQGGVQVAGAVQQLVMTANRALQGLVPYVVDPGTRGLQRVGQGVLRATNFEPEAVTLYRSPSDGRVYAFAGNTVGTTPTVVQFELTFTQEGAVTGTEVRRIPLDSPATGLVADDAQGYLFIAERNQGITRVTAEPGTSTSRTLIASVASGVLVAPVGGVALYGAVGSDGYLVVANTGADGFTLYNRQAPHALVGSFQVVRSTTVDAVTDPRSVEVSALALGSLFPQGAFIAHDATNESVENYKLIPWPLVANAFSPPLQIEGAPQTDGGTSTPDGGGGSGPPGGPTGPSLPLDDPTSTACSCSSASVPGTALLALLALALRGRRRKG
jgi:3-phytase